MNKLLLILILLLSSCADFSTIYYKDEHGYKNLITVRTEYTKRLVKGDSVRLSDYDCCKSGTVIVDTVINQ